MQNIQTISGRRRQSLRNELQLLNAAGARENWLVEQHFAENAAEPHHNYILILWKRRHLLLQSCCVCVVKR
jgi:hypothetical protein